MQFQIDNVASICSCTLTVLLNVLSVATIRKVDLNSISHTQSNLKYFRRSKETQVKFTLKYQSHEKQHPNLTQINW